MTARALKTEEYRITKEPYYASQGDEIALFEAAFANRLPVLLKGPTGCGKTRFMEHLAWRLKRPLITVSCHDDLTASDLVGRYLITAGETVWVDGPMARAVHTGKLIASGIAPRAACRSAIAEALTDDAEMLAAVNELGASLFWAQTL